jgi:hypothetical protein
LLLVTGPCFGQAGPTPDSSRALTQDIPWDDNGHTCGNTPSLGTSAFCMYPWKLTQNSKKQILKMILQNDMFRWALKHTNVEVEVRLLKEGQTKKQVQPMKHHLHNIWEYQGIKLHSCINTWPVCSVFWQPEPIIIYLLIWLCVKTHPNTSRNHKHSARTIIVFV